MCTHTVPSALQMTHLPLVYLSHLLSGIYPPFHPIILAIARTKFHFGRCATCSVKRLYLGLRVVMVSHLGPYYRPTGLVMCIPADLRSHGGWLAGSRIRFAVGVRIEIPEGPWRLYAPPHTKPACKSHHMHPTATPGRRNRTSVAIFVWKLWW